MKLITTHQHLTAVCGGSLGYSMITQGGAVLGSLTGMVLGLVAAGAGGKHPGGCCALLIFPIMGGALGSVGGYVGGAITYTIVNNIGTIVSAPFKLINFIFAPRE